MHGMGMTTPRPPLRRDATREQVAREIASLDREIILYRTMTLIALGAGVVAAIIIGWHAG